MPIIVPFDGSELSKSALLHGLNSGNLYQDNLLAVSVIPDGDTQYAREKGWITTDEEFDNELIVSRLRKQVVDIAPEADFKHISVSRYAPTGVIAKRIRHIIRDRDTSAVFIGSENAGHHTQGAESIGGRVMSDDNCNITIIRNTVAEVVQERESDRDSLVA